MRFSWLLGGIVALAIGCDGGGGNDAGPPDAGPQPIELTVQTATATDNIDGSVAAPAGFQYYVLAVTLRAREIGPLGVAPSAFSLFLTDATRASGNSITTGIMDGCVSQSVALGASVSCRVAFQVLLDAAAPETLEWTDGMPLHEATASVPALTP